MLHIINTPSSEHEYNYCPQLEYFTQLIFLLCPDKIYISLALVLLYENILISLSSEQVANCLSLGLNSIQLIPF